MPRLIDAHDLWAHIYKLSVKHRWKDRTNIAFSKCLDTIQFFPTVEAEPVRHGHWINHFDDLFPMESTVECSICGEKEWMMTIINHNYCPNCGAKMDEEEKDA